MQNAPKPTACEYSPYQSTCVASRHFRGPRTGYCLPWRVRTRRQVCFARARFLSLWLARLQCNAAIMQEWAIGGLAKQKRIRSAFCYRRSPHTLAMKVHIARSIACKPAAREVAQFRHAWTGDSCAADSVRLGRYDNRSPERMPLAMRCAGVVPIN